MEYRQLTPETVVDYIKNLDSMTRIFSRFDNLSIHEVGDGNLNYVYTITNPDKPVETVVLKQAVPYLRVVGDSWPLAKERMKFEIMALQRQKELCPKYVPDVFHADEPMCLIIMQNLNKHKILRGEIILGKTFPFLADHISTFLARTLYASSDLALDSTTKKHRVAEFINTDLCNLTENFVFTNAFEKHDTNEYNPELTEADINSVQENAKLKIAVAEMKYKFMNNAEAMVHGDLHIGSIMANEEETYVIDPEFAFYGPMGFDIGAFIGNLFMSYFSHEHRQKLLGREPYEYRNWLLNTIMATWNGFEQKFDQLWLNDHNNADSLYWNYEGGEEHFSQQRQAFLKKLFSDSMGFGACKMMRRIFGLAKVADIADIEDLKERARIERMTLKLAEYMVVDRDRIENIESVVAAAKDLSPLV
ncbi:S-methyl-5-thioribose kinase [bacterium]|nr:S-methyl-5-thioribose kinase [bacterium]